MKARDAYPLSSPFSELALDPERILIDFQHPSAQPVPLIIGMKGYKQPKRALVERERLVVVAEEFDLVTYLFFCADGRLCAIEVLGS